MKVVIIDQELRVYLDSGTFCISAELHCHCW